MKRTLLAMLLAVVLCLSLAACAGTPAKTVTETDTSVQPGYVMTFDGVEIRMGETASAALDALGEAISREATGSCAYGGDDVRYTYAHFILQTYDQSGTEYLSQISLSDDTYATPEGIRVGDSADAVKAAYGTPANETASALTYLKGNTKLLFLLRDGNVTNIQYLLQ